jgi:hypothetical protein
MGKSFFELLKRIAEKIGCKFWFALDPPISGQKTVFFYTQDEVTKGAVKNRGVPFKYVLRGILNEDALQFPCYSFAPNSDGDAWIRRGTNPQAGGVNMAVIDADGHPTGNADSIDELLKPTDLSAAISGALERDVPTSSDAEGNVIDIDQAGRAAVTVYAPFRANSVGAMKQAMQNFMLQGSGGLAGTISTIGVPEEEVGRLCELRGCGMIFDSLFYIEKIAHEWSPGDWKMSLTVHRQGTQSTSEKTGETAGGQMQ